MKGKNKFLASGRLALALAGALLALAAQPVEAADQAAEQAHAAAQREMKEAARPEAAKNVVGVEDVLEAMRKAEPAEVVEARAYVDKALKDCWLMLDNGGRGKVTWVHADEVVAMAQANRDAIAVRIRMDGWLGASTSAYRTVASTPITSDGMGELALKRLRSRINECKRGARGFQDIESSDRSSSATRNFKP